MSKPDSLRRITPDQIAEELQIPLEQLFAISEKVSRLYHPTRIQTIKGKTRELDVPKEYLKRKLKKLHGLFQKLRWFSKAAHGGITSRSPFSSARQHLGYNVVVIRDVSNCYPSCTPEQLRLAMESKGIHKDTVRLLEKLLTCRGRIPQGAPTSCDALNLFLWDLDDQMLNFCGHDVRYTRMADDHVLSGDSLQRVEDAAKHLESLLAMKGLSVCERKKMEKGLQISPRPQEVHSIGVNHPRLTRIPKPRSREYCRRADALVHSARCVTPESLPSLAMKRRQLNGYMNYASQADISPAKHIARRLKEVDMIICRRLTEQHVTRSRDWWRDPSRSIELARRWEFLLNGLGCAPNKEAVGNKRKGDQRRHQNPTTIRRSVNEIQIRSPQ